VKNIVVVGASYAGSHVAEVLASTLPKTHRVILIDKNSHFNHLYRFVRFGVVPGHEAKAFIPYTNIFNKGGTSDILTEHHCPRGEETMDRTQQYPKSIFIHGNVVSASKNFVEVDRTLCEADGITKNCVVEHDPPSNCGAYERAKANGTLDQGFNCLCLNGDEEPMQQHLNKTTKIRFDYLVFATGSILPRPLWSGSRTKDQGMRFLQDQQDVIERASSILIVGGGALGIQYATDIADLYPSKRVTLIHSRDRLLPIFTEGIHELAMKRLEELHVDVILGDRVILPEGHKFEGKELDHRVIHTQGGRQIESDLQLFCTGQKPNTSIVQKIMPTAINAKDGTIKVKRTMQVNAPGHNVPNIFAVGDCIDGFGAIKAGHTGWFQAGVAANNILKIVRARETGEALEPLQEYEPGKPMISLSLGLGESVKQTINAEGELVVTENKGEEVDSDWARMWTSMGVLADDPFI